MVPALTYYLLFSDFAFLAGIAYRSDEMAQEDLDGWFGVGNATLDVELVDEYRTQAGTSSAVSFKLVVFPVSNYAYVLIRGTTNNWDMLTDAQLWSAAALFQALRELLPVGAMWTPGTSFGFGEWN